MKNVNNSIGNKADNPSKGKELFLKYLYYLPLFIVVLSISLFVAYKYIGYQTRIYSSSVSVIMANDKNNGTPTGNEGFLQDVMLYNNTVNLSTEMEVFKTKTLMARVVSKLKANLQYYVIGEIRTSESYKNFPIKTEFLSLTDSSKTYLIEVGREEEELYVNVNGKQFPVTANSLITTAGMACRLSFNPNNINETDKYLIKWEPIDAAAQTLISSLSVFQPNANSNILKIDILTESHQRGVDVLDELINQYNILSVEKKDRVVSSSTRFINERIALLSSELGKVEGGIQSYRQANEVVAPELQNSEGITQASLARKSADDAEVKLKVISMINQFISSPANKYQLFPSSLGIEDPTLNSLVGQYNNLQLTREEQVKTMPAANPAVRTTESQIEKVRSSIMNTLSNTTEATSQSRNRYADEYQSYRSRLLAVPRQERQLVEIGRQQSIKERLYMFLLEKREETAITRATSGDEATTTLDPASSTSVPVSPDTAAIYKLAIIIGLGLPFAFVLLKDLLNDKIITKNDISAITAMPIIGQITRNETKRRNLVVGAHERSVLAEQFRMIRSNLPLITKGGDGKVLMVTSLMSGEGKSFCSINLAAVFAISGKKTIVLEFDLRKPTISKALNVPEKTKGFVHYMSGDFDPALVPVRVPEYDDLYVLPAGIIPPNPSEMLMDKKVDKLFAYLREHFDCIVIDTAPVGLVSDANNLAKFCDATLFVIRQRYTTKKHLREVNEIYESGVFPNISIIVNDVKAKGMNSYYGYNYNSPYNNSYYFQEKSTIWKKFKKKSPSDSVV